MRPFDQVVHAVGTYALCFPEKHGQPLAIAIFDGHGVLREARFTRLDAQNLLLQEVVERARECLRNGRDTATDEGAQKLRCQAVILRTRKGREGVVVIAGYGSKTNAILARYGRDFHFGGKLKPIPLENSHGKA